MLDEITACSFDTVAEEPALVALSEETVADEAADNLLTLETHLAYAEDPDATTASEALTVETVAADIENDADVFASP